MQPAPFSDMRFVVAGSPALAGLRLTTYTWSRPGLDIVDSTVDSTSEFRPNMDLCAHES